jgi:hypothetical protein
VLVYDHFAGDNSCLKFTIKFKRKKYIFLYIYLMQLFSADTTIFKKNKKTIAPRNIKNCPQK